ncbi:MAG TPA: 4-aminobutyrate--2-oxoglutarate transaminase [Thermomicrobiales bacterium]|nr:4-aminobutyrate--2-oxoglutarate transaminase [Thermomicrobiales bacterium]
MRSLRETYVSRSVSHSTPVVAEKAHGAELWDVDGRRYLDFAGGIGTLNVGHTHPLVVNAIVSQAHQLTHAMFGVAMYPSYILLAEALAHLTPGSFDKKSVLVNSGAEAIENAIKIARAATGRSRIISFTNAFHGRTAMTMALTHKEKPYRYGFGPLPDDQVIRVPFPYEYRPSFPGNETQGCLDALRTAFEDHPGEIAAVVFEPIQGEGGFIVSPNTWLQGVVDLARQHGAVSIADEIQTGFGRTGRWFAVEHAGVEPDLIVMAKSLAGGMPLAAVTGRAELMDAPIVGGLGGTFGGNPVSCAAALAVIDAMKTESIIAQGVEIGALIETEFEAWREEIDLIGDVRGRGAMMALELVRDQTTKEPADRETARVIELAWQRGLILIRAGSLDNVIRILVPLVASQANIQEGLKILKQAILDASAS